MSALEYMLLDQCSSKKFVSTFTEKQFDTSVQLVSLTKGVSAATESSAKEAAKDGKRSQATQARAHSASQTDPVDTDQAADFDWDLSDRNDSETQTRNPSSVHSDDATVQTDQRIVFRPADKKVSFSSEAVIDNSGRSSGKSRHPKHSWSQTRYFNVHYNFHMPAITSSF